MTEAYWLACTDPIAMLKHLVGTASDRKVRLFGCVCCRTVWPFLVEKRSRKAVTFAEESVDNLPSIQEEQKVLESACQASDELEELYVAGPYRAEHQGRWYAATMAYRLLCRPVSAYIDEIAFGAMFCSDITPLLRDIFGNPFRPVTFTPECRTSTAVALAKQMYDSRDFSAMPILADALQDAGCDNDGILNHCRDANQAHVRGCWVVDLILGKE